MPEVQAVAFQSHPLCWWYKQETVAFQINSLRWRYKELPFK